jgi:hypothetical protein
MAPEPHGIVAFGPVLDEARIAECRFEIGKLVQVEPLRLAALVTKTWRMAQPQQPIDPDDITRRLLTLGLMDRPDFLA